MEDLNQVFKRVSELTAKYPLLNKDEVKELRDLAKGLSVECSEALYDWDK